MSNPTFSLSVCVYVCVCVCWFVDSANKRVSITVCDWLARERAIHSHRISDEETALFEDTNREEKQHSSLLVMLCSSFHVLLIRYYKLLL